MSSRRKKVYLVKKSCLSGKLSLSGSKHSGLRICVLSLLTDEEFLVENCPADLRDAETLFGMLKLLGKDVRRSEHRLSISDSGNGLQSVITWHEDSIRVTLLILAALLTRCSYVKVPLPGGCRLGPRPFDLHKYVLESMGARIWRDGESVYGLCRSRLKGASVNLPIASNGATETAVIAGVVADGTTRITGGHLTPELHDLIDCLVKMDADISFDGQTIVVRGQKQLRGVHHRVIADNVEAITYVIGAGISGGQVLIKRFPFRPLGPIIYKLEKIGVRVQQLGGDLHVSGGDFNSFDIAAGAYPGVYSDMQPLFAVLALRCQGDSRISDQRWPGRFQYVAALKDLEAPLSFSNGYLYASGVSRLRGTRVLANDVRAGAALILAGLVADGITEIHGAEQIDRGYERIEEKLTAIGADIESRHIVDESRR